MATLEELGLQLRTKKTNGQDKLHRLGVGYVNEELYRAPEPDYSFIPTPEQKSPREDDFSNIPLPPQQLKLKTPGASDPTEIVREHFRDPATRYAKTIMGTDAAEMVFSDLANFGAIQPDTEEKLNVAQKSGAKFARGSYELLLDATAYASALAGRDDIAKNVADFRRRNMPLFGLPSSKKEFDLSDLTKPDFWAEQAPATIALFLAARTGGAIGGGAFASGAARVGLSEKAVGVAKFIGQIFGGTIPATGAEAFMEASGTYTQAMESMLASGKSEKEAQEKASNAAAATFTDNLAFLAGTNALEYYTALGKLPRGLRNKFTRYVVSKAKNAGIERGGRRALFGALNVGGKGVAAATESAEEVIQGWIQQTAQDYVEGNKPDTALEIKDLLTKLDEMKPDTQAEILVGLGMGLLFQAGGSFDEYMGRRKKLERKAKTNPQELKRDIESIINEEEELKNSLNIPKVETPQEDVAPKGQAAPIEQAPPQAGVAVETEAPLSQPTVAPAHPQTTEQEAAASQPQTTEAEEPIETVEAEITVDEYDGLRLAVEQKKAEAQQDGESGLNADELDLSILEDEEVKSLYRSMAVEMAIPGKDDLSEVDRAAIKDVLDARGMGIVDADIENAMNLRKLLKGSLGRGKFAKKVIDEMMNRPALRKRESKRLQSGVRTVAKREQSYLIPIKSIQTDEDRFQLRKEPYSEETAQEVAENYDEEKFEPIVVWQEEGDAKPFVLSGHSRLEGMKRRGEKLIPARIFEGTEQEAMAVAAAESMENTPKSERKDDVIKPRVTPQIPAEEGTKYVLSTFATHGARRKGTESKTEKPPKSITKHRRKLPGSLVHGAFISAVSVDRVETLSPSETKAALRALEGESKARRTPQEIDAAILERTVELEQGGATAEEMRDDPALKALDEESREAYAENEKAMRKLFGQKEPEGEPDFSTEALGEDIDKFFSSLDYDLGKSDIVPESAPSVDDLTKTLKKQKQVEVTGRDGGSLTYAIKDVKIGDTDAGKKLEITRTSDGELVKELGVNDVAGLAVGSPVKELIDNAEEEIKVQLALFEDEKKDEVPSGREKETGTRKRSAKHRSSDKADRGGVRAGTETRREGLQEKTRAGVGEGATPERIEIATGVVESTSTPATVLPVFRIKDVALDYKNTLSRFRDNLAALKVLHELRASRRAPTEQQQTILSKYVGWGGLAQAAFDESNQSNISKYAVEREQLKRLLTPGELKAARASTINAHYTSYPIVRAMWNALQHFGFNGGKVLEPGSGIGNFAGLVPDALLENTRLTGVEMDNISVEIARHLYPNNTFLHSPFQDVGFQENTFDAVIGNVPFGNVPIYDPALEKRVGKSLSIHNYFIYKSITLLKPGGIAAVITSRYTMDAKTNADFRKSLGEIASLVGAVRLPSEAFQSNAATEVVTDILFFRKRDNSKIEKNLKSEFEKTAKTSFYGTKSHKYVEFEINEYFAANDNMIYGRQNDSGKMQFGNLYNVDKHDFKDSKAESDIGNLVTTLPSGIFTPKEVARAEEKVQKLADLSLTDKTRARNGSIVETDDEIVVVSGFDVESGKAKVESFPGSAKELKVARGIVEIKRAIFDLYDTQQSVDAADEDVAKTMKSLNESYDRFVSKNGFLHERANSSVFARDPDAPHLYALENYDQETKKATKTDIFNSRVIDKTRLFTSAATPLDAVAISINEKGYVDVDRIAQLLDISIDDAEQKLQDENLAFKNPGSGYELAAEYLSGDVVTKLEVARNAAKTEKSFERNVKALKAVQPKPVPPERIYVSPGAAWIPIDVYVDFFSHLMNFNMTPYIRVDRDAFDNGYKVTVYGSAFHQYDFDDTLRRSQWGTDDVPAEEIFLNVLNSQQPTVTQKTQTGTVVDEAKTAEARVRARQMIQEFSEWIMDETTRRERITGIFNDRFNRLVPRDHYRAGNILTFDGMAPAWRDKLHQHQKDGIYRALFGNTLFNVVVGGGKTAILIGTAMEAKRIGIAKKPILVVKKNTLLQFRSDFLSLYPSAKILVADDVNFTKSERQKFLARISTGNWDAIIITHSAFGFIPMSEQFQSKFYRDVIDEMVEALEPLKKEHGSRDRTVKDIEKRIQSLEAKIEKLSDMRKDDLTTFEQLGIDMMLVDEAHNFKNLFFVSKHRDVLGLGKRDGGKKTFDMFMKTQYLSELNGGERGVVFATGTPVENSLAELYHILRYLKPRTLKQLGLTSFDAFASTFAEATVEVERKATGQYKPTLRFMKFKNLLQLSTLNSTFMEVKTLNDLPSLKQIVPARKGGKAQVVEAPRSDEMSWYMEFLYQRAKNLKKAEEGSDNHLVIATDARKAALSISMVASGYRSKTPTKIDAAIDKIFEVWKEGRADKSAQLLFSDLGVPTKTPTKKEGTAEPDEETLDFDSGFESEAKPGVEYIRDAIVEITRRKKNTNREQLNEFFLAVARTERGSRYSVYDEIKNALIKRGVPKEEIVFVQDFKTDEQKKQMQAKVREGKYRIVLASTSTFGEGTNVQSRLSAIHHLDIPWTPAKLEQRNGRGFRMGNMFLNKGGVYEFRYVTLDSHDAVMWQKIEQKAHFTESFFAGAQQEMEDIMSTTILDAAEMRSIATGNPMFKRFIELRILIDQLQAEEKAHKSKVFRAQRDLENIPKDQIILRGKLGQYEHIQKTVEDTENNETFKLGDESFEKRTELSEKLVGIMTSQKNEAAVLNNGGKLMEFARGEWKGIPFVITGEHGGNQYGVIFKIAQDELPGSGYVHFEKKADTPTPEGINAFFRKNRERVSKLIEETKLEMAQNEKALVTVKEISAQKFKRAEELRSSLSEFEIVTASLNQSEANEDADVPAELQDDSVEAAFMPTNDELEENAITAQDRHSGKVESRCKDAL